MRYVISERQYKLLIEQSDVVTYQVGKVYKFFPAHKSPDMELMVPTDETKSFDAEVLSDSNGVLELKVGGQKKTYTEKFFDTMDSKQRYFCSKLNPKECIMDEDLGFTKSFKRAGTSKLADFLSMGQSKLKTPLTDDNFDSVVNNSQKLFIVDFNASWCMPCKKLEKYLYELLEEMPDVFEIGSVDIDAETETKKRFKIEGVPVLMFTKNGNVLKRTDGIVSKEELSKIIKTLK